MSWIRGRFEGTTIGVLVGGSSTSDEMRRYSTELGLTLRQRNFFYELIDSPPEPVAAD